MSIIIKRIRKILPHTNKGLRLNRAEFGHDFFEVGKNNFFNFYYPDVRTLISKIRALLFKY